MGNECCGGLKINQMSINTTPKTVRLRNDLIIALEKKCVDENRNFSNLVETLLLEKLKLDPFD